MKRFATAALFALGVAGAVFGAGSASAEDPPYGGSWQDYYNQCHASGQGCAVRPEDLTPGGGMPWNADDSINNANPNPAPAQAPSAAPCSDPDAIQVCSQY